MLANFFKKSVPVSFVTLLLLLVFYIGVKSFGGEKGVYIEEFYLFAVRFLMFGGFLIIVSFMVSKNKLTQQNYYALFVFTVLFGIFPNTLEVSRLSISHLLLLLGYRRIYNFQSKKDRLIKLYDSGFLLGVAFILYPLSILYILLIYISYALYIKTVEKELMIPLLGFITPIFLAFVYFYLFDEVLILRNIIELNIGFNFRVMEDLFSVRIVIAFILLVSVFSSIHKLQKSDNETKNKIRLVLSHLGLSIIVIVSYNYIVEESIQFVFFPLSVTLGTLIESQQRIWLKELVMIGLLLLSFLGFII
jgi:hypothetical protein